MVLSNSTPKQNELVLDTATMNSADLSQLLQLNAEIEERRSRHAQCDISNVNGLLTATMTREELFEVSSFDDDRFLTALEHQNSYVTPSRIQVTDLDLSSIENLMKYFDEEVPVTPSKDICSGKVASAIAKLANQTAAAAQAKSRVDSGSIKISKLKQKYEQPQLATPQAVRGTNNKTSGKLPMKVKEMAQLFNSKFNQVMGRAEAPHYSMLHNEVSLSPESKPQPQPQQLPRQRQQQGKCLLPEPLPRQKPQQHQGTCLSPEPLPRQKPQQQQGTCLIAEDVFRELSVKDKVLLFNKFVSDIAVKHPNSKFNEHAAELKAQATQKMARGEVIAEEQISVKHLAQELEAKLQATLSNPPSTTKTNPSEKSTPSLHVSTLTVVLKPSPERHVIALPVGQAVQREQCISQKRNLAAIRTVLPTEAYAPPKKIRRTRQERIGHDSLHFFQNEPLESLFYSWLSAENGVLFDITSVSNSEQTIEIASSDELPAQLTASSIGDLSQKSAVERLLEEAIAKLELESCLSKEATHVEEKEVNTAVTTPATPTPRKIKRQAPPVPAPRPSLAQSQSICITSSSSSSCKQSEAEESESGLSTLPKITSDESQAEMPASAADAGEFDFTKPVRPPRKKKMRRTLTWKKENSIVEATANAVTSTDSDSDYKPAALLAKKKSPTNSMPEQSYIELDKSLMRQVNSPRKIKSAYTLTVMSSPSPNSDQSPSQTPRQSLDQQLRDSFIDQGFETCSNDAMDASPMRRPSLSLGNGKPSGFSTPVKTRNGSIAAQQQLFSPIGLTNQLDKSRRSSLAMQVIREDHPLDLAATSDAPTTPTYSEREFFANAPTVEMSSSQLEELPVSQPQSRFWISAGDFNVSLEIVHNTPERLRLLYNIFTQKSWETRELTFGIDGHKFCRSAAGVQETKPSPLPERPASVKGSHYWFASGDLAVPFSGKHMPSEKIERLFQFLDAELNTGTELELRFGVDHFEFSSVPEFWHTTPKFSIESSYSMLVGLQTGNSNGLEGRSKYAWPNNHSSISNHQAIKTSDLDQTEFESDSFSNNSGRLSFSPDLFSQDYEAVPLDELFEKTLPIVRSTPMSMPQMLRTLQQQQTKLKSVEQRIRNYELPPNLNEATLKQCRSKPEYAHKLRAIDNIARSSGFRACSMDELESFMQFLIEYADVCLGSCSEHIEKIIDTLLDRRSVAV